MTLQISWQKAPIYPALIKGSSVGVVDGNLLVAGGMSYPWREVEYGFGAPILEDTGDSQDDAPPIGEWYPLPPIPIGPGWTSGAAVAGGLAVVGGRRRAVGNRATADVWFLDLQSGATDWERLPDRPSPAMVPTTFAHDDLLYTAFGTDWHPHEHATGDPNIYRMDVRNRGGWEIAAQFPGEARWMCGMGISRANSTLSAATTSLSEASSTPSPTMPSACSETTKDMAIGLATSPSAKAGNVTWQQETGGNCRVPLAPSSPMPSPWKIAGSS